MKKRIKILFPTDFSEPAAHAFRYALMLADTLDADIQLVHSIFPDTLPSDVPVVSGESTQVKTEVAEKAMKAFTEIGLTQLVWHLNKISDIKGEVLVGMPIPTIVRFAEKENIDLIIMGTRGEHKGVDKLMGSVAAGVVYKASCPVMVVPEQAPFKKPERIAYATDVVEADPFEIWKMIQLMGSFQPLVHCVHFSMGKKVKEEAKSVEEMKAFFEERSSPAKITFYNLPGKKLEDDLNDFIEDKEIDVLVMFQPKRNFLERLFHRSQVKKMAISSQVPLLVQKEGR